MHQTDWLLGARKSAVNAVAADEQAQLESPVHGLTYTTHAGCNAATEAAAGRHQHPRSRTSNPGLGHLGDDGHIPQLCVHSVQVPVRTASHELLAIRPPGQGCHSWGQSLAPQPLHTQLPQQPGDILR